MSGAGGKPFAEVDLAVVGAGIVGIAMAWAASRLGMRVALIDRHDRQIGASIRNFGMIWPIGQPSGLMPRALRSRELWLEAARVAGVWHEPVGSLGVAYCEDELAAMEEFAARHGGDGYQVQMLSPESAMERSAWLVREGLRGGLFSRTEICVDPRQAVAAMTRYLSTLERVDVRLGSPVVSVEHPVVRLASGATIAAERVAVCTGEETRLLFPEVYRGSGLTICTLQMMRTAPVPEGFGRLGPMLYAGSTLRHYRSFAGCPSVARVRERFARERPEFDRWGIHVMASQTATGELTLGDSHVYGEPVEPFLREEIDALVLGYLRTFLRPPEVRVVERWKGSYPKFMDARTEFVASPSAGVKVVNGVGGAGMTLSFALAEEVLRGWTS